MNPFVSSPNHVNQVQDLTSHLDSLLDICQLLFRLYLLLLLLSSATIFSDITELLLLPSACLLIFHCLLPLMDMVPSVIMLEVFLKWLALDKMFVILLMLLMLLETLLLLLEKVSLLVALHLFLLPFMEVSFIIQASNSAH